jgi:16S rRNA (guanine966-N2)-methyltransferase
MRIIAGEYKRRKLHEVLSKTTRSTKDRVKETMFNMISPTINITNTLDVFAGSGALGLEALSRYQCHTDFVEVDHEAFTVLKQNITMLNVTALTNAYHDQALSFLTKQDKPYDFIILDPPYHQSLVNQALKTIAENALLHPHGLMVSLTHKEEKITVPSSVIITKQRTVGITTITFYETE